MLSRSEALPRTYTDVKYHKSNIPIPDPPYLNYKNVVNITIGRQLWVDDYLIDSSNNIKWVHHQAIDATPGSILPPTKFESRSNSPLPDAIIYDPLAKEFKMWYIANYDQVPHKLCLATSNNGVDWIRPDISKIEGWSFQTFDPCCSKCQKYNSKNLGQNNIICSFGGCRSMKGRGSGSIVMDLEEKDPNRRFKLAWGGFRQIKIYYSPDGIRWTPSQKDGGWVGGSVWYMGFNPFRQRFIFTMRDNLSYAARGWLARYMEVDNVEDTWPKWDDGGGNGNPKYKAGQPVQYSMSDNLDIHYTSRKPGVYCAYMAPYESIMVNLFSIFHSGDGFGKRMSLYSGYSRDGFHYTRDNETRDKPLIPETNSKFYICPAGGNICISNDNNRIMLYYFYKTGNKMNTGCATLRRDGFVNVTNLDKAIESTIVTKSLVSTGGYLFVNCITRDNGFMLVEILNVDGNVRSGFSKDKCKGVSTKIDSTQSIIQWQGSEQIGVKSGEEFKMRFIFKNCDFYSFWISSSRAGESNGYIGNGGPLFKSYQDKIGDRVPNSGKVYPFPTDENQVVKSMRHMTNFSDKKTKENKPVVDEQAKENNKVVTKKESVAEKEEPTIEKTDVEKKEIKLSDQIGRTSGQKFTKLNFDYYDLKRENIVAKSQPLNIDDVVGFTTGNVIYEDFSKRGGGTNKYGRKVSIDLNVIVDGGDVVIKRYLLFHNKVANSRVEQLLLR